MGKSRTLVQKRKIREKARSIKSENGLRKVKNLINSRPTLAEIGLAKRDNGIRLQKKE